VVERIVPEIVIGFVAPSGTDFDLVTTMVGNRLAHYGYQSVTIRLSEFLRQRAVAAERLADDETDYGHRTKVLQAEGNLFRNESKRNDALAFVAMQEIVAARIEKNGQGRDDSGLQPVKATAYLLWSFKTPEEVATLRAIYRSRFFAVSVYTPRAERANTLASKIAASHNRIGNPSTPDKTAAEEIVAADEHEDLEGVVAPGQNVRNAYPLADFFVDPRSEEARPESVERAVDIIFGHPYLTPTRDEFGMFVANAAALRSAELGRQVGAAVANDLGDILATGYNEVPAAHGGQYGPESAHDDREFRRGGDSSDQLRHMLIQQIEQELREVDALKEGKDSTLAVQAALRATHIEGLTEFGRALHAEASTFLDAARRGVAVRDETMYVTTFPCHQCTRQVIASGIKRLVYIYPYAKSLAERLHGDAIQVDGGEPGTKLPFEPFVGVAPRRYVEAFTMGKRKDKDGKAFPFDDRNRSPRLFPGDDDHIWEAGTYIVREQNALKVVAEIFSPTRPDRPPKEKVHEPETGPVRPPIPKRRE
jgi:deoxycytidylate deaminase